MKLQNKKTGEIIDLANGHICESISGESLALKPSIASSKKYTYNSLAELNEEWEDAPEEPETYYYISDLGNIESLTNDHGQNLPEEIWHKAIKRRKEIGNHFKTEEKTEKAVKKLKAWKRLENKGFRFNKWTILEEPKTPHIKLVIEAEMDVPDSPYDLDLLFGGEE